MKCNDTHWRIHGRGGGNPAIAQEGEPSCLLPCPPKAPKKLLFFIVHFFFESEFGSIQKTSGLNPWSFEFWQYPRLEPRAKLPLPLKPAAGSASDDTFHIISLIKKTSSAIVDLAFFLW